MRDTAEFDDFYAMTSRRVVGQVYAMTGNLAEAEDATAEAFVKAWDRWDDVRTSDSPEAWVRRVASRNAISSWRRVVNRRRAHQWEAFHRSSSATPGVSADHVALVEALRRINADQRRAIVLHHLVGLSVEDVAAEVGAPTGTVKTRLARGRRALAGHLAEHTDIDTEKHLERRSTGHV